MGYLRISDKYLRISFWGELPDGSDCEREDCLTTTCDQWENDKPISSIKTSQASIAHGAKTDSDLARLPGVDHPAGRTDSDLAATIRPRSMLARVFSLGAQHAAGNRPRSERTRVPVTRSAARSGSRMRLPGRLGDRGGAGRRRTGP